MLGRAFLPKLFLLLGFCLISIAGPAPNAWTQTPAASGESTISKPFSENFIQAEIEKIDKKTSITAEVKQALSDIYDSALERLLEGENDNINAANYRSKREFAPQEIAELENRIQKIRDQLNELGYNPLSAYSDYDLEQFEIELADKVAEAATIRNSKAADVTARATLAQRPGLARSELDNVLSDIENLNSQLVAAKTENLTDLERAGNVQLRATLFARQHKARSLEQELAANQSQLNVVDKRLTLREVQKIQTEGVVRALQNETGSARTMNAEQQLSDAEQALENVAERHPYVQQYARENINLIIKLKSLVEAQEDMPAAEARIRAQLAQISADANVTKQILDNNKGSRSYGVHLRQLRQKQPSLGVIRAKIAERSVKLEKALFQRIVNQEALQAFNTGSVNFNIDFTQFENNQRKKSETPIEFQEVTPQDIEALRTLLDYRRDSLEELASFSAQRAARLDEVNALETKLLNDARELCERLDGRLLWLPSTEAVGFDWPKKLFLGAAP